MEIKTLVILLSMMVLTCHAQTATPTIKGHKLGETLEQFIANASPVTREQIQLCAATNDRNRYTVDGCEAYLDSFKFGLEAEVECQDPIFKIGVCRDFRGYAKFSNNKLVELHLEIIDKDWDDALPDVITKFGKPNEIHTVTTQNAYGAKFDLQTASWTKPEYLVTTFEKINVPYNLKKFVEVTITARAYFQSQQAKKSSALD